MIVATIESPNGVEIADGIVRPTNAAGLCLAGPQAWMDREGFDFFQPPDETYFIRPGVRDSLRAAPTGAEPAEGAENQARASIRSTRASSLPWLSAATKVAPVRNPAADEGLASMGLIFFLGRFHVLVLHIPIGIIVAIFVLELLARKDRYRHLERASPFLWAAAAVSAVVTVVLGYMHFAEGGFDSAVGYQHRTFGTALAVLVTLVAILRTSRFAPNYLPVYLPAAALMLLLASITGHYGGNLTHGPNFLLEYAPQPIRSLMGLPRRRPPVESYAAADPFLDLVGPMFQSHCSDCHNRSKHESDLVLTSYEGVIRGGETGSVVVSGRPDVSELLKRITLPQDDESFMPADGKTPLTGAEERIIRWWIAAGLPNGTRMDQVELAPDPEIEALIRDALGLGPGV
jgi:uncharacterized membrane protein